MAVAIEAAAPSDSSLQRGPQNALVQKMRRAPNEAPPPPRIPHAVAGSGVYCVTITLALRLWRRPPARGSRAAPG